MFTRIVLFFGLSSLAALAQKTDQPADPTGPDHAADSTGVTMLDPFVVSGAEDQGKYEATATTAANRIRTELKDVGSAISVVTAQFLKDTNSHSSQDLLVYTTNTEVGGPGGNFSGLSGHGSTLSDEAARLAPQTNTRVRGLTAADNTRDFFLTDIPWDSFNTGRIDIQRGPNAILFGLGSPAGIINASPNGAAFKNEGSLQFSGGSYGSRRATLDVNAVLRPQELALRLDALDDRTEYEQEPAFNHDRRIYGALRWDPKFLSRGSAHTSFRVNYEHGRIEANRPHVLPPGDRITPWFTALNKAGVDPATWPSDPAVQSLVENLFSSGTTLSAIFNNRSSTDSTLIQDIGPGFTTLAQVLDPVHYRPTSSSPAEQYKVYLATLLQDPSIFDYVHKLPEGPNKREWSSHDIANVTLAQTFLGDRLGVEAAYDRQETSRSAMNGSDGLPLTVDINTRSVDGSLNPNFGRAFIQTSGTDGSAFKSTREAARLTGFGEFRFKDLMGNSRWAHVLGRHVFTGLWSRERADTEQYEWLGQVPDSTFTPYYGDPFIQDRSIGTYNYLGASLVNRATAAGANLPNLSTVQEVHARSLRFFDGGSGDWIDLPVNVVNNSSGAREQARDASLRRDVVESQALVWQGFLFDDLVVPMVGLRHDRDRSYALTNPPTQADGSVDFASPVYRLPSVPNNVVSGNSTSWSVVVHSPKFIRDKLPGDTEVSVFYNDSENFQPKAGRIDPLGQPLAPPVGRTKDFGFRVTTLGGRLTAKVNWYDTLVANDALPPFGNFYYLTATEIWGYQFARQNLEELYNYSGGYRPADPAQTAAEARADGIAIARAFLAPANQPPDSFFALYGLDRVQYANQGGIHPTDPASLGVTITGDTRSKGVEYELTAQPVPNWNIAFNAAQTDAQSHNLAKSVSAWIEQRWAVFNTPVAGTSRPAVIGDLRLFGPDYPGYTVLQAYHDNIWIPYQIFRAEENSHVSEMRPWRFNFITDYTFARRRLKGLKVGGAYRWQDKEVVGYPVFPQAGSSSTVPVFDLAHPFTGPVDTKVDLWIGYERKFSKKYRWHVQLNVNNVFAKNNLIPVTVQPDGTLAAGRIPEPMTWTLTNSISF